MELQSLLSEFTYRDWETIDEAEPIRFAVVGLGGFTRGHVLPAIENADYCTPTVVVSSSPEKIDETTAQYDIERGISYEEFHAGEAADRYDAVYICTPNATHPEYVETAAELGKDVLCEKPLAATSDGARRVIDACDEHDVTLMVAYRMLAAPAVRRLRAIVREGIIGTPIQVHGHMSDCLPELVPDPDQWRLNPDLSGGTTLNDLGVYPLNTLRFVLDRDPVGVYAETVADHEWFEGRDEHATFQIEFEGGVSAACTVSHNAYAASHLRVIGSEGEVTLEPALLPADDRELTVRHGGSTATVAPENCDEIVEEFDYFAHCLITGEEPVPDGRNGLVDLEAIEAMYESAERGERIDL